MIYVLTALEADSFHCCPWSGGATALVVDSNYNVLCRYGVTHTAWWNQLITLSAQSVHSTLACAPRCDPSGTFSRELAFDRARESGKHTVIRIHALELMNFTLQAKEIKFHSQTSARLGTSERCVLQRWTDVQQSPTSFVWTGIDAFRGNFTPSASRSQPHLQQTGTYIWISCRRMSHFFAIFSIITIRYQTCQRLLRIGQAASKQWLGSSNRIGKYLVPERRKLSSYHCKCVVRSSDYQNFRLRGRAETK